MLSSTLTPAIMSFDGLDDLFFSVAFLHCEISNPLGYWNLHRGHGVNFGGKVILLKVLL